MYVKFFVFNLLIRGIKTFLVLYNQLNIVKILSFMYSIILDIVGLTLTYFS